MQFKPKFIREYLLSISNHWLTGMSGGLSVPFGIGAVFFTGHEREICVALTLVAFIIASYGVWAREHATVLELRKKLAPWIKLSFAPADCIKETTRKLKMVANRYVPGDPDTHYMDVDVNAYAVRIGVENTGVDPTGIFDARLISIEREMNGSFGPVGYTDNLHFDVKFQALTKGVREYIDVLVLDAQLAIPALTVRERGTADHFIKEIGNYRLGVQVSCYGGEPQRICLLFEWRGQFESPRMSVVSV